MEKETLGKEAEAVMHLRYMHTDIYWLYSKYFAFEEWLLRNGFREEIGLPMTDTGHRESL